MRLISAFSAFVALGSSAVAGEIIDMSSVGKGKSMTVVHPISETHAVMQMHTEYTEFENVDAAAPQVTGECFGSAEMIGASVDGTGNCRFAEAEGDYYLINWDIAGMAEDGALVGTWAILGGTGKFAGASGGGNFHSVTDQSTGLFENKVSGVMLLP